MASKRSADHLIPDNSPQYKKAANKLVSGLGPTSTTPHGSNYVHSRTSSAQKIIKLPITQPVQQLSSAHPVCAQSTSPQVSDLDAGNSTSMAAPSGRPIPTGPRLSAAKYRAPYLEDRTRKQEQPPTKDPSDRPIASETSSTARTQLANIGNTIASLEAQLHEARQQIASEQHNARCKQQLAEDNANMIVSLKSELAGAQVSLNDTKRAQVRLEEANANLKARCNDFARERSEKLTLQEELREARASHEGWHRERTVLQEKLEQATKQLAEHVKNAQTDAAVRDLLNLVDPSDLEHIAITLARLKSVLDGRSGNQARNRLKVEKMDSV